MKTLFGFLISFWGIFGLSKLFEYWMIGRWPVEIINKTHLIGGLSFYIACILTLIFIFGIIDKKLFK